MEPNQLQEMEAVRRLIDDPTTPAEGTISLGGQETRYRRSLGPTAAVTLATEGEPGGMTMFAEAPSPHAEYPSELPFVPGAECTVMRGESLGASWWLRGDADAVLDDLIGRLSEGGWDRQPEEFSMPGIRGVQLTRGGETRTLTAMRVPGGAMIILKDGDSG